jgi:hypothetical protein
MNSGATGTTRFVHRGSWKVNSDQTPKANALEPWAYLNYLFERLPSAKTPAAIEALLPFHLKNDDLKPIGSIP